MTEKQQTQISREWRFRIMIVATIITIAAAQLIVEISMPSATIEDQLAVSPLIGAAGGAALIASMVILGEFSNDDE